MTGRADISDDVAGLDRTELAEAREMCVVQVAERTVDVDPEPAQLAAGDGCHAVERCEDRRPGCGNDVVALVPMEPATGLGARVAEVVGDRVGLSDRTQGERPQPRDLAPDLLD